MAAYQVKNPVAMMIFNRPDTTLRVFECIRQVKPKKLLIVADGPRADRAGEAERCAQARSIAQRVDWDCEVLTEFAETNLGCRKRVSSGVTWIYSQVERAIILEDDCLPSPDFFPYCDELLERYQDDERVMQISGSNYHPELSLQGGRANFSYRFSNMPYIWGWAGWRRAWKHYDEKITLWPELRERGMLRSIWRNSAIERFWTRKFDQILQGFNTWDYQWTFACFSQRGLCIVPAQNLISNIGFGIEATHTIVKGECAELPLGHLNFPLRHPPYVMHDFDADLAYAKMLSSIPQRIKNRLRTYGQKYLGVGR